jgi:hypothetical protein
MPTLETSSEPSLRRPLTVAALPGSLTAAPRAEYRPRVTKGAAAIAAAVPTRNFRRLRSAPGFNDSSLIDHTGLRVASNGADPLHHLRIAVIEEGRLLGVQRSDCRHVFGAELEIEDREIFRHPFLSHRLGNCDYSALCEPPENHLRNPLVVLRGNPAQEFVLEDVVFTFGERAPRFDLDVVLLKEFLRFNLLVERMRLDLIDGRRQLVVQNEVHHAVGMKVTDADRPDAALAV